MCTDKSMACTWKQHVHCPVPGAEYSLGAYNQRALRCRRLPQLHEGHQVHALVLRLVHHKFDPLVVPPKAEEGEEGGGALAPSIKTTAVGDGCSGVDVRTCCAGC